MTGRIVRLMMVVLGLCVTLGSADAQTACRLESANTSLPEGIQFFQDQRRSVVVFSAQMRRDDDGAPNAYHPCGANFEDGVCGATYGLDHICSGAIIRDASGERIPPSEPVPPNGRPSSRRCLAGFREAQANGYPSCDHAGRTCVLSWPGIVLQDRPDARPGLDRRVPAIYASGPYRGYYVSSTTLHRPNSRVPGGNEFLDARRVPYVVIPGSSVLTGPDWEFGSTTRPDLALVVLRPRRGATRAVFAVIGDTGPRAQTGEGSPALLGRLQRRSDLASERPGVAALPNSTFPNRPTYILFRNSGHLLSDVWPARNLTAADIAAAGIRALAAVGGFSAIAGCAGLPSDARNIEFATD